ncbi:MULTISPECIES: hypothetical protein [Lacticaseibacillus]|uniref:hypothetical protein n=1 Tax=Lacticaseibacillus TaxID=2759736 RepID=UPI000532C08F|nr:MULTISPECIES: hypothetical protein [Lacticaseibacillus]RDF83292.1 hypothetical protein DQM24_06185 [Lacticaseibacillus paracasei]RNE28115.1 hypothetical protein FAM6165_02131 [Lacticaseibacillus paracasei]RWZ62060.1 hypothetical protein EQH89_02380 [Lacticaseibacillus paracasei]TEA87870.1 hypothetical protein TE33_06625 [Lacticaseibacillus paracasei]
MNSPETKLNKKYSPIYGDGISVSANDVQMAVDGIVATLSRHTSNLAEAKAILDLIDLDQYAELKLIK